MASFAAAAVLALAGTAGAQEQDEAPVPTATPAVEATATPGPTPEPTPSPEPVPVATPYDYRAGMPGVYPGPRPVRGSIQAGLHAFFGSGWNGSGELETGDYLGGAGIVAAVWDWTPIVAGVGSLGFASGEDAPSGPVQKITISVMQATVGVRLQTPAAKQGVYVQAGAGLFRGSRQIDPGILQPVLEDTSEGFTLHAAGGVTIHASQGVDTFVEIRGSTAPGEFDDDALELGGITTTVGISLRL